MTMIRRTSPFGELLSLRQAMDRLMEDSFVRPKSGLTADEHPLALDLYTTPDALVVEAALPGVKPEDINVSLLGDQLTISATSGDERSSEENGHSYREIRRGSFSRSVTLPTGINADGARASFDNGLLRLHIPRAEEAKARQIPISATPRTVTQPSTQPSDPPTDAPSTDRES
jgi:HSP20 family protein